VSVIDDCRVFELRQIPRREGKITPVEGGRDIPFDIARVYYLYDVPGGETRGGHAHKELQQLFVSVMGSFDVLLDDGRAQRVVTLNRGYRGLYVPRLIWRELLNFSSGAVCLVLASHPYEEGDYIRDYGVFLETKRA
jgi:dTDP-4-dehydrorhamnose 3,5-epimerase-like enzyme